MQSYIYLCKSIQPAIQLFNKLFDLGNYKNDVISLTLEDNDFSEEEKEGHVRACMELDRRNVFRIWKSLFGEKISGSWKVILQLAEEDYREEKIALAIDYLLQLEK